MSKFKLRIYNKKTHEMYPPSQWNIRVTLDGKVLDYKVPGQHQDITEDCIFLPWTGKTDKEQTDIFTGDILEDMRQYRVLVEWDSEDMAFRFRVINRQGISDVPGSWVNVAKVIGNKYKNPELV